MMRWLNSTVVKVYKLLGFAILFAILFGLVSYLSTQLFFVVSDGWAAPTLLDASHGRVMKANAERAQQSLRYAQLQGELQSAEVELDHLERRLQMHARFRERFAASLADKRRVRRRQVRELARVSELHGRTRSQMDAALGEYVEGTASQTGVALAAGLIDKQTALQRRYTVLQAMRYRTELAVEAVELKGMLHEAKNAASGLSALMADAPTQQAKAAIDFETLRMAQEYERAEVDIAHLEASRAPLVARAKALRKAVTRYEKLLALAERSPFLRAVDAPVALLFVPYENLARATPGAPLYSCDLGLLWCERVGEVRVAVEGEVTAAHPLYSRQMRGRFVEVSLSEAEAVKQRLLFLGRRPLGL